MSPNLIHFDFRAENELNFIFLSEFLFLQFIDIYELIKRLITKLIKNFIFQKKNLSKFESKEIIYEFFEFKTFPDFKHILQKRPKTALLRELIVD